MQQWLGESFAVFTSFFGISPCFCFNCRIPGDDRKTEMTWLPRQARLDSALASPLFMNTVCSKCWSLPGLSWTTRSGPVWRADTSFTFLLSIDENRGREWRGSQGIHIQYQCVEQRRAPIINCVTKVMTPQAVLKSIIQKLLFTEAWSRLKLNTWHEQSHNRCFVT